MAEDTDPVQGAQDEPNLEINPPGVDELAPEAPPDEPSPDDSAEAENTEDEPPLRELLLRIVNHDEGLTSSTGLGELSRLLSGGAEVDAKGADGGTALHLAAANGLVEAATMLIDAGAKVSETDNEDRQPLHRACSEGHTELARLLLDKKADINAKQHQKATPLHEACWPGHLDVVKLLLERGANTQITEEDNWSPLHAASRGSHTEVVRALLEKDKTNIDAKEALAGWTALNLAVYHGNGDAVSALLKERANVGVRDNDGWTPLMTATRQKHEGIMKELLGQEGDFQPETLELETLNDSGHTPLLAASIYGFSAGARLLIKAGADCNFQSDISKATPLIAASGWRYREIVEALLEDSGRTDVNTQDEEGSAALHFASNHGHSKIVEILLQHQVDVNLVNDDGQTALHMASKKGNESVVKLLLDAEAKVDARDQDGKTALHLASGAGPEDSSEQDGDQLGPDDLSPDERDMMEFGTGRHAAVVKRLLESKARPDTKTNKNETALHLAAARGDPDRLGLILGIMEQEHMSTRNDQGRTALYSACTGDNAKLAVESLLKSDKLRTAEFGRSDGEDDEINWAANHPETHEIAKWLMEERWERKEMPKREGSGNWSVIEWAAYSRLPEVLSSLMAKSSGSSEIQAFLKSALESVLEPKSESNSQPANELSLEILSLLITNSPPTPDIKAELKSALEKTLDLALVKGVKQRLGHRQLLQVLSVLIHSFSGTPDIDATLKSTLELVKTPKEGMMYEQLSQVLWLLIANSSPTPDIKKELDSAWKSASDLARRTKDRTQDPEQVSMTTRIPKAETGAPFKGKNKDPGKAKYEREMSQQTVPTTRTTKDQTDYLHAIMDILRDPPFSQTYKDSKMDGPPKHNDRLSEILASLETTVVQFYKGEGESGTFRRYRSLKEVIYDDGPGRIMEKTISDLRKILGGRSELADSTMYLNTEPKFTWVHLPATNMVWMNDILLRIMNDEKCEARSYHELKSFFRDSWTQVPDRTSSSRSMRPRTVEKKGETREEQRGRTEGKKEEEKKQEEKDRGEKSGKTKKDGESEEDRQKKNNPDFGVASAIYMPYLCFSTQYRDEPNLGKDQKKFNDMKMTYEGLNDPKNPVIHESPTLDEWYYHFATDEKSTKDRRKRNRTQVVTKAIEGVKDTNEDDESTTGGKKNDEPSQWTLLRVNQLWVWTIANEWLITATSCLFDGSHDTLVEGILDQLGKEAEAGGSASQPESTAEMSRFIVNYCIGSYERLPKPQVLNAQGQGSIRQIFSNTINQIGRDETALFEEFRKKTERWREQLPTELKKPRKKTTSRSPKDSSDETSEALYQATTYADIRAAIKKAEKMYCEIKDIRDELNILKSAARHQKTVEEGLTGESLDVDLAAAYIVNDLKEMDNGAERIQSAINTTLSLLQSENANLQATLSLEQSRLSNRLAKLATRQGKTLMVFTVVTILFLPLSFLSSLFALDVASFQQAPGWAFAVIFAVSFAFSIITALIAQRWDKISPHLKALEKFMPKKYTKGEPEPHKEETVNKHEDKDTLERGPELSSGSATGDTDKHQQSFFFRLRGRPSREQRGGELA